ncbi:MAG: disulfide bond formation protein B [Halobacteriales archaeon]|nr:disulfide bond formation protein B [Halobacteriales archaeon]
MPVRINGIRPIGSREWLGAATVVAAVATTGSLWFSLGLGLVPCELCWYQRILMYPLVVVLGVATVESRSAVWRTVLPLALPGAAIAAYHSALQVTAASCRLTGPCAAVLWRTPVVGLTIPNLSLIAFVLITGFVVINARGADQH